MEPDAQKPAGGGDDDAAVIDARVRELAYQGRLPPATRETLADDDLEGLVDLSPLYCEE